MKYIHPSIGYKKHVHRNIFLWNNIQYHYPHSYPYPYPYTYTYPYPCQYSFCRMVIEIRVSCLSMISPMIASALHAFTQDGNMI
jgi:hypothetical protein